MYCVYLTSYKGNKLPPFYVGSTSINKIKRGYRGSVSSQKWREIWRAEIKQNPSLFKTQIVKTLSTRTEAARLERALQIKLNVVNNPMYINLAVSTLSGSFTSTLRGKDNSSFGKPRTAEVKNKIKLARSSRTTEQNFQSYSRVKSEEEIQKLRAHQKTKMKGSGNSRARLWTLVSPTNEIISLNGNFKTWCRENKMPSGSPVLRFDGSLMTSGKWSGWKITRH